MNKLDLATRLAKQSHRSRAKAADDVDALVYHLLKDLKRSPAAEQPVPERTEKRPGSTSKSAAPKENR